MKPTPAPMPYWKKEEANRNPKEWSNAGFSAAEKKAMAAKKMAEMKSKAKKTFKIPASPTH
jgi:hypothetical protein